MTLPATNVLRDHIWVANAYGLWIYKVQCRDPEKMHLNDHDLFLGHTDLQGQD